MQPVNDGDLIVRRGAKRNPHGSRRRGPRVFHMKNARVTIVIRINIAACLFGLAAILKVLI